jgi:hypothetical protein
LVSGKLWDRGRLERLFVEAIAPDAGNVAKPE